MKWCDRLREITPGVAVVERLYLADTGPSDLSAAGYTKDRV